MGQTSSQEIKKIINNKMMMKSEFESISTQMNNINTKIENDIKQAAMTNVESVNERNIDGMTITAKGKGTKLDMSQENDAKVSVTVEQMSKIMNDVNESIASMINQAVEQAIDIEQLTKLMTDAEKKAETSATAAASIGSSDKQKIEEQINNETEVEIKQKFEQHVENVVSTAIENHSSKTCGINFLAKNKQNLSNITADLSEGAEVDMSQKNKIEITDDCKQFDEVNNNIIINLCNDFGIQLDNEIKLKNSTDSSTSAKQTTDNKGLGSEIADVADGIGGMFSSLFNSTTYIFIGISLVVCCVVFVVIFGLSYVMTDETGSKTLMGVTNTVANAATSATPTGAVAKVISGGCDSISYGFIRKAIKEM